MKKYLVLGAVLLSFSPPYKESMAGFISSYIGAHAGASSATSPEGMTDRQVEAARYTIHAATRHPTYPRVRYVYIDVREIRTFTLLKEHAGCSGDPVAEVILTSGQRFFIHDREAVDAISNYRNSVSMEDPNHVKK